MKKPIIRTLFIALLVNFQVNAVPKSADSILQKSISVHDPENQWSNTSLELHVQEPRVGNPARFSKVTLLPKTGEFTLIRNREQSLATYQIKANGDTQVNLDGQQVESKEIIRKYRLQPERVASYRHFYLHMIGLPMSLPSNLKSISRTDDVTFNQREAYALDITLHSPVFTDNWIVYVDKQDYRYLGMDIIDNTMAENSERLIFEGDYTYKNISLPRFRQWYYLNTNRYLGSDIIVE